MFVARFFSVIFLANNALCFAYYYYFDMDIPPEASNNASDSSCVGEDCGWDDLTFVNVANSLENDEKCPHSESSFSKEDVTTMIEYIESKMNIMDVLNSTYYPKALRTRDYTVKMFKELKERLETRPENLKNILDDIDATRVKLEPIVGQYVKKLQQYASYEAMFGTINNRAQALLQPLDKYKHLCEFNNCGRPPPKTAQNTVDTNSRLNTATESDEHYCSSLKDLTNRIKTNLTVFRNAFNEVLMGKLDQDEEKYKGKIAAIRSKVKESAISMFGMTMYEILSLQDDYHQFADELKSSNTSAAMNLIVKNTLEVEYKLLELADGVDKYHAYCLNCEQNFKTYKHTLEDTSDSSDISEDSLEDTSDSSDISEDSLNIDILITDKVNKIKEMIMKKYTEIFEDLDKVLYDPNLIDILIKNLQPIQQEVSTQITKRQEALLNIKNSISQAMIAKIFILSQKSQELLGSVDTALGFIHKYV